MDGNKGSQYFFDNGKIKCCFVQIPAKLITTQCQSSYNIVMADVSGSMNDCWDEVVEGWNNYISNKLICGESDIYVFGSEVTFIRKGTMLTDTDYLNGCTDLTSALEVIGEHISNCSISYVRVFLITDGMHNVSDISPESAIEKMCIPDGKICEVYLLGIGVSFPVEISINLRSTLHNGNLNVPTLFWAKNNEDIEEQMAQIGSELGKGFVEINLPLEGYKLPYTVATMKSWLGEWVYYPDVVHGISEASADDKKIYFEVPKAITPEVLLNDIYPQWNSILLQLHRNKQKVPIEIFNLMEDMFNYLISQIAIEESVSTSIDMRLKKKRKKRLEADYATAMNNCKSVIILEKKYESEIELADVVLKTTVKSKYDHKIMKMKGHSKTDYEKDMAHFKQIFDSCYSIIQNASPPGADECCRVLCVSTLSDLQDPNFNDLCELNKYDFLKSFTITGVPVLTSLRDSTQINPWTLVIQRVLVEPYAVLSQRALEFSAETQANTNDFGGTMLSADDENSVFNAIVPTLPQHYAEDLKPIVLSNIYQMCTTFCILKNAIIIDYSCHLAALACVWLKTITEFRSALRPEYVKNRIECIKATASLYTDKKSNYLYNDVLSSEPEQALMTESSKIFNNKSVYCESLVKPLFFSWLYSKQINATFLKLILLEYIGRCFSNYKSQYKKSNIYTDLFVKDLNTEALKEKWISDQIVKIKEKCKIIEDELTKHYTLENALKDAKERISKIFVSASYAKEFTISVWMEKLKKLRNFGSCGDIHLDSIYAWAEEMNFPKIMIEEAFSEEMMTVYVYHALQYALSKDRLASPVLSYDDTICEIQKKVDKESFMYIKEILLKETLKEANALYLKRFLHIHADVVQPLEIIQIIDLANENGINVTNKTFCELYKYNEKLGLLRNACQSPKCPFFLKPSRSFNQHVSIERMPPFPHALHLVAYNYCKEGMERVLLEIVSGRHSGKNGRKMVNAPNDIEHLTVQIQQLVDFYSKIKK